MTGALTSFSPSPNMLSCHTLSIWILLEGHVGILVWADGECNSGRLRLTPTNHLVLQPILTRVSHITPVPYSRACHCVCLSGKYITVEQLYDQHQGISEIVLYCMEVSLFQRLSNTVGHEQVSLMERCPLFRGSLIERFHCI